MGRGFWFLMIGMYVPVMMAAGLAVLEAKRLKGKLSRTTLLVILVVTVMALTNLFHVLIQAFLISPGRGGPDFALWLFDFLPMSFLFAIVIGVGLQHWLEAREA